MEMKIAKPTQDDFACVLYFFNMTESIFEDGVDMETGENVAGAEQFELMRTQWKKISPSWNRVLWAGKMAIDNACDPDCDVLEFSPKILAALGLQGRMETLVKSLRVRAELFRTMARSAIGEEKYICRGVADGSEEAADDVVKAIKS